MVWDTNTHVFECAGCGHIHKDSEIAEAQKTACRTERSHIASLMNTLEDELDDPDMTEDNWLVAGSLCYVRKLLADAVGHLKGVEGSEIVNAMVNESL